MNPKSCFIIAYDLTDFNRLEWFCIWAASDRAGVTKTIKDKIIIYIFIERGTLGLNLKFVVPSTIYYCKTESC